MQAPGLSTEAALRKAAAAPGEQEQEVAALKHAGRANQAARTHNALAAAATKALVQAAVNTAKGSPGSRQYQCGT